MIENLSSGDSRRTHCPMKHSVAANAYQKVWASAPTRLQRIWVQTIHPRREARERGCTHAFLRQEHYPDARGSSIAPEPGEFPCHWSTLNLHARGQKRTPSKDKFQRNGHCPNHPRPDAWAAGANDETHRGKYRANEPVSRDAELDLPDRVSTLELRSTGRRA